MYYNMPASDMNLDKECFSLRNEISEYTVQLYKHKSGKQAILYLLRACFFYKETKQWLSYINRNPLLAGHKNTSIELAAKIYRPFLRTSYSVAERISLLTSHIELMAKHFPVALASAIWEGKKTELIRLEGKKEGLPYILTIYRDCKFDKEGELTIALQAEGSIVPLAATSFVLGHNQSGGVIIMIGGLQGPTPASEDNKRNVIKATRELGGLRPKRAVIEAVCAVAKHIGATEIHSPSNMAHISKHLSKEKQRIYSDYDQFWAEIGGTKTDDGTYLIPAILPRRDVSEVPAKKRKDWLIRTEHLNAIASRIPGVLSGVL